MSLRKNCRELILDVVLRRALSAEGSESQGRLQLVVDEAASRVLNSFLRMGDLHAEGVTSMELLGRAREPLPELDGLYLMGAGQINVDLVLSDFKAPLEPQHRHVHLVMTQPLAADLLGKLAECANLAPRMKSLMEVPLGFVAIQDRGFHFDMPEALPGLFPVPDPMLVDTVVHRLVDVCRCMEVLSPGIRYAQSDLCKNVAHGLQAQLAAAMTGGRTETPPTQLLIVDRSIDMAAVLVHEYTYEAMVVDLLAGDCFNVGSNVVTKAGQDMLLSEADTLWEELKHLHLEAAKAVVQERVAQIIEQRQTKDASELKTSELLEMARRCPEQMQAVGRVELHQFLLGRLNQRIDEEQLVTSLGWIEQDIACGVDRNGKDVKATNVQTSLSKALGESEHKLTSEAKLRLLMLYFACMANVQESQRQKLMDMAQLASDDHYVLMSMIRTRLMEVPDSQRHKLGTGNAHRVTKEQAARFKKNANTDGRFQLSRFEPRIKELVLNFFERRLCVEDFPILSEPPSPAGVAPPGAPTMQAKDNWSFAPVDAKSKVYNDGGVTRRVIVFVLGGIGHSELRACAEAALELPRGTEVLLGGTSMVTPKTLIETLRPKAETVRSSVSSQAASSTVIGNTVDTAELLA